VILYHIFTENYCRYNFNSYGDEIAHLSKRPPLFTNDGDLPENVPTEEALNVVVDFADFAKKNNVKVYYSFPPLLDTQFDVDKAAIMRIYNAVKKIDGITVIDSPENYIFPLNSIYDQKYHLMGEGRETRTTTLISNFLKASSAIKK
jgi:hypothetical protein